VALAAEESLRVRKAGGEVIRETCVTTAHHSSDLLRKRLSRVDTSPS
jgi:hypothetical protein